MTQGNYHTVEEIAEMLKYHPQTIRSLIRQKKLVAHLIGGEYRVYQADFDDFLRRTRTVQRDEPKNDLVGARS